jgi:hypothetical protein
MKHFGTITRMAQSAGVIVAVAAALLVPCTAAASGAEAKVNMTLTILKQARLTIVTQPSAVIVTAADIARGYVDVPAPADVAVQTNSAHGYMLEIGSVGDFVRQIVVRGLGNEVQLSSAGGWVKQSAQGSGVTKATLALGFRFLLSEAAREGSYAWPVNLSVTPI